MNNSPSLTEIILHADLTALVRLSALLQNAEEYPTARDINELVLARIAYLRKLGSHQSPS